MIRPYAPRDTDALVDVWYAAAHIAYSFVPDTFWETEREDLRQKYLPLAQTWVYEHDGGLIGFISLLENEIGGLFVRPEYQGRGVGTRLIQHARALCGNLFVRVFQQNPQALQFYEKCGFVGDAASLHEATGCVLLTMKQGDCP